MQAPSVCLLRALLRPSPCCARQLRQASTKATKSGFVDPKKYHKINALDKLHRRQKEALRQEKLATEDRAKSMESPFYPDVVPLAQAASQTPLLASALPYSIGRTPSSNLPVYHLAKAGGNKHLTTIRKLSGDLSALQQDIRVALGLEPFVMDRQGRKKENVAINWTTRQIVIRGWRGPEVKKWAELRGF